MTERERVLKLADRLLDEPHADPDDDVRTLARELVRAEERVERLTAVNADMLAACEAIKSLELWLVFPMRPDHMAPGEWKRFNQALAAVDAAIAKATA